MALADPSARWSAAPGLTLGQSATNTTRNLGQEIDALFKWSLVRISGYSAYFVDLTPEMQREIIDRSCQRAR